MNIPDLWCLIEWDGQHHVLASWRGGYLDGDSWRRSTPIVHVEDHGDFRIITTKSGSRYKLYKNNYGYSRHYPIERPETAFLNNGQAEVFLQQFSQSA